MVTHRSPPVAANRSLADVLLGYLAAGWGSTPGADGLTVGDVLAGYPAAVAARAVPDWAELVCRHPDLRDDLLGWLAADGRWQFLDRRPAVAAATPVG
jgi:hypothetical protein